MVRVFAICLAFALSAPAFSGPLIPIFEQLFIPAAGLDQIDSSTDLEKSSPQLGCDKNGNLTSKHLHKIEELRASEEKLSLYLRTMEHVANVAKRAVSSPNELFDIVFRFPLTPAAASAISEIIAFYEDHGSTELADLWRLKQNSDFPDGEHQAKRLQFDFEKLLSNLPAPTATTVHPEGRALMLYLGMMGTKTLKKLFPNSRFLRAPCDALSRPWYVEQLTEKFVSARDSGRTDLLLRSIKEMREMKNESARFSDHLHSTVFKYNSVVTRESIEALVALGAVNEKKLIEIAQSGVENAKLPAYTGLSGFANVESFAGSEADLLLWSSAMEKLELEEDPAARNYFSLVRTSEARCAELLAVAKNSSMPSLKKLIAFHAVGLLNCSKEQSYLAHWATNEKDLLLQTAAIQALGNIDDLNAETVAVLTEILSNESKFSSQEYLYAVANVKNRIAAAEALSNSAKVFEPQVDACLDILSGAQEEDLEQTCLNLMFKAQRPNLAQVKRLAGIFKIERRELLKNLGIYEVFAAWMKFHPVIIRSILFENLGTTHKREVLSSLVYASGEDAWSFRVALSTEMKAVCEAKNRRACWNLIDALAVLGSDSDGDEAYLIALYAKSTSISYRGTYLYLEDTGSYRISILNALSKIDHCSEKTLDLLASASFDTAFVEVNQPALQLYNDCFSTKL